MKIALVKNKQTKKPPKFIPCRERWGGLRKTLWRLVGGSQGVWWPFHCSQSLPVHACPCPPSFPAERLEHNKQEYFNGNAWGVTSLVMSPEHMTGALEGCQLPGNREALARLGPSPDSLTRPCSRVPRSCSFPRKPHWPPLPLSGLPFLSPVMHPSFSHRLPGDLPRFIP